MNTRAKRFLFPLMLFIYLPLAAYCQVQASLDSAQILIGDETHLRIKISLPKGDQLILIGTDTLGTVKGLERRRANPLDSTEYVQGMTYSRAFVLSAFDSGYYRLPPIPVDIRTSEGLERLYSNSLVLQVRPIPVEADTARLQPIKGIWKEPVRVTDFWPLLLAVLAVPLIVFLVKRLRNRKAAVAPAAPAPPPPPAHEVAMEQLHALWNSGILEKGQFKQYQSELTHILKEYVSRRYAVQALESVTEEVREMLEDAGVEKRWSEDVIQVLRDADRVKFAKAELPAEQHQVAWQVIFDFVQATKPEEYDGRME
ncbi:MAG: hypothetical protein ACOYOO_04310 [Saprospiraceae bacterium]